MGQSHAVEDVHVPNGYTLLAPLGQGGMGAVYRVREDLSGRTLALKRLILDPEASESGAARAKLFGELFEREYYTLSQLAHPRVIEVFDFGVDEVGPYYTMELLEGADLRNLAPMPWRDACAVVRDAASSLAILHSRRLLHRDVSPGNVRRTADGRAKLLDFGAMTSFGVARDVVGTVPCIAPESFRHEPLDPRSDLFSLGATLYFALTGQWPYRAARLSDLVSAWKAAPTPPSEIAAGVPAALDALVGAMLSVDPRGRPGDAAAVIDRLEGIAGLEPGDAVGAARAYLTTPILVGRAPFLETFRSLLARAHRGQGGIFYVEASPGLGRSRMLQAFGLEAKLSGAVVLAASGEDALAGPFGMARVWVDALLRSRPEAAIAAAHASGATLGHVSADLHAQLGRPPLASFASAQERTLRVQAELRAWIERVARKHRICLLADDLDGADPESAGLVAGLTERIRSSRLVLVASASASADESAGASPPSPRTAGAHGAARLVRDAATIVRLAPLTRDEMEELLRSVFGDAPRVELLATFFHRQTAGSPGLCMEIAAYLLERGHVRYEGGAWVLPESPDRLEVPAAHDELLAERLAGLSQDARALLECRALALDVAPLSIRDLERLLDGDDAPARTGAALAEAMSRDLLVPAAGSASYVFAHPSLGRVICAALDEVTLRARHASLARALLERADRPLIASFHLLGAGDGAAALACLLDSDLDPAEVPPDQSAAVVPVLESAVEEARRQGRAPYDEIRLLTMLLGCCATLDRDLSHHTDALARHMRRDSGLDIWETLDPDLEPGRRSAMALARANEVYERTPEAERGVAPAAAITLIGQTLGAIVVFAARVRDSRAIWDAARLLEPLAPLSPMAAFQHDILRTAARYTSGIEIGDAYRRHAQRARDEAVPGMPASMRSHTYLLCGFYDAWVECEFDEHAEWIEEVTDALLADPIYRVQGWQLRFAYHAARGRAVEMAAARRSRDLAMVESALVSQHASSGLLFELTFAIRMRDLLALKRLRGPLDAQMERFPLWRATALHAHAEYHLARGELDRARHFCEEAIRAAAPGEIAQWCHLVASCLRIMLLQGYVEEACERGVAALRVAAERELRWRAVASIELVLGLVEVAAGRKEQGFARIDQVRQAFEACAYAGDEVMQIEVEAALAAGDGDRFRAALARFGEFCRSGQHPALLALYEQLAESGRRRFEGARADAVADPEEVRARSLVRARLDLTGDAAERIRRALSLLVEESGASAGYLFVMRGGALVSAGAQDGSAVSPGLDRAVRDYFLRESEFVTEMTVTQLSGTVSARTQWVIDGSTFEPATLGCRVDDEPCLAGVVAIKYGSEPPAGPAPALLTAVAEHLAECGDAEPVPVLDL